MTTATSKPIDIYARVPARATSSSAASAARSQPAARSSPSASLPAGSHTRTTAGPRGTRAIKRAGWDAAHGRLESGAAAA